ncbi:MAG: hypothetical protein A2672_00235 [Candidatus Wildermuthbacteria bacterium RIFCSPHIGHO2_01_FULL_49_22b]|uniref:O-antigen ligase-related domain-containing protein n=1 Tax=Candidatus Wildermuthbacteria bacterium RIFCSPHIGHO2_01_FULL_49_22b TaxID=1802448 RepID=A0A1G2R2N5_9BACT|nr:MAG: hypothetical protein A2672_00235 [Candidatus Wildermuthbacteria bacterium RIFCSPHIGHO2_01_FULL_49_22b]
MNGNTSTESTPSVVEGLSTGWYWTFFWGFIAILLLPLLNIPPLFSPPAWGQTVAFRLLFGLLVLGFLWQLTKTRNLSFLVPHGPARVPWTLLYALGVVLLIAAVFSLDPKNSFWSDPSRAWGIVNYLFYIAFAVSLFLILKTKEWQRLWYVLLATGTGLSLLAAFQNFGWFSGTLITYGRPVATLGNPLFLAMTLIPLTLMGFVWLLQERSTKRRTAIGAALLLFLYAIFITVSRSAFIGLGAGVLFFALAAPKQAAFLKLARIGVLGTVLLGVLLLWYVNTNPAPDFLRKVPNAVSLWGRFSVERSIEDARFAAWELALKAAVEKPILGYGPYNAFLALDKFYDSSVATLRVSIGWWDTTHNIFVDYLLETGLVGLAAFLALLASLFWKLQETQRRKPELRLQIIGAQAAFLAYLVQGMFSFNTFATYLVFFFLVAYSLFLISTASPQISQSPIANHQYPNSNTRLALFGLLSVFLLWFLWQHTLAPLWVNKEMNVAVFQAQQGRCQQAIDKAEELSSPSPQLDYYLPAQYTNVIRACLPSGSEDPQTRVLLSLKAGQVLDRAAAARPQYSRTYLTKADYLNIVLTYLQKGEQREAIARQAQEALQKAQELSPKRVELYAKWAQTARLQGKYGEAVERANECLYLNNEYSDCIWEKVLANVYLGDLEAVDEDMEELNRRRSWPIPYLNQLALAYQTIGDKQRMATAYELLVFRTENLQYAASLALAHKQLGNWNDAHKATLLMLQWQPDLQSQVEEFLEPIRGILRQDCSAGNTSSCWRLSLVELTFHNEQGATLARIRAEQLGLSTSSEETLKDLAEVYLANQDTPQLMETYQKLAELAKQRGDEDNAQEYIQRAQDLLNKLPQ